MRRTSVSKIETYAGRALRINRRVVAAAAAVARDRETDRQTDRQTPNRCYTLSAMDATSVKWSSKQNLQRQAARELYGSVFRWTEVVHLTDLSRNDVDGHDLRVHLSIATSLK